MLQTDPLAVKSGYSTGCKTLSTWDISGIKQYPINLQMVSKNGNKISQGSVGMAPGNVTVTIEDRMIPRTSSTTGPNPSYFNTRFNETYNKPFWATSAPNAIT